MNYDCMADIDTSDQTLRKYPQTFDYSCSNQRSQEKDYSDYTHQHAAHNYYILPFVDRMQ
jgi:hypothetical protein